MNRLINKMKLKTLWVLTWVLLPYISYAGIITQWNMDNVVTDAGPYMLNETYASHIYTDTFLTNSNGAVIWVESDVLSPGLGVVNNDEINGSNCVMTAGFNPVDMSVKQCSDEFQFSKRFKLSSTQTGTALDLVFDVAESINSNEAYRMLEKLFNSTNFQVSNMSIELGFGTGENFIPAPDNIGLDFSDNAGQIFVGEVLTGQTSSLNLDALLPFGLFGDASTDPNQDIDGYFDPVNRARFNLSATRGRISSTGLSGNYFDVFGYLLAKSQALNGYFWDHDNDDLTDPILIAHQTELGWFSLRPDQWWTDFMLPIPETNLLDGTLTDETLASWANSPNDYNMDPIEDLANINLNYHINVGDISLWPSYDGMAQTAQFTVRLSTYSVIFKNGFE